MFQIMAAMEGDVEWRAAREVRFAQMGELSAGRQALEGVEVAPQKSFWFKAFWLKAIHFCSNIKGFSFVAFAPIETWYTQMLVGGGGWMGPVHPTAPSPRLALVHGGKPSAASGKVQKGSHQSVGDGGAINHSVVRNRVMSQVWSGLLQHWGERMGVSKPNSKQRCNVPEKAKVVAPNRALVPCDDRSCMKPECEVGKSSRSIGGPFETRS